MQKIRIASALLALATLTSTPAALAATADHQQCYKIKDDAAATAYTATLVPGDVTFPTATGCTLKSKAKLLCIDVDKTGVTPPPPGADPGLPAQKSLCYKVKCPVLPSAITTTLADQFGSHGVTLSKTSLLCVPIPAPVTTTTLPGSCATAMDCPPVSNATPACQAGSCVIGSCDAGFADCNVNPLDGCEVNLTNNPSNCGMCGLMCNVQNAMATCTMGNCTIGACSSGYLDCNNSPMDGCEVGVNTDPSNCGSCGLVCSIPNATPSCNAGICAIGSCDAGYLDCDGNVMTGCETNVLSDHSNCGGCNTVCPMATPNCVNASCTP